MTLLSCVGVSLLILIIGGTFIYKKIMNKPCKKEVNEFFITEAKLDRLPRGFPEGKYRFKFLQKETTTISGEKKTKVYILIQIYAVPHWRTDGKRMWLTIHKQELN